MPRREKENRNYAKRAKEDGVLRGAKKRTSRDHLEGGSGR